MQRKMRGGRGGHSGMKKGHDFNTLRASNRGGASNYSVHSMRDPGYGWDSGYGRDIDYRDRGSGKNFGFSRDTDYGMDSSYLRDTSYGGESSRYRMGSGGGYDRDLVESLLLQRALQQQLNLRESQLALASTLLQQQQQQQQAQLYKNLAARQGDHRQDVKQSRRRTQYKDHDRGRGSAQGNKSYNSRRNESSSSQSSERQTSGKARDSKKSDAANKPVADKKSGQSTKVKAGGDKGVPTKNKKQLAGESNKAGGGDKEETTRSRRQVAEGQTDQTNEAVTSEEEDEDLEKGEAGTNEGEKKKQRYCTVCDVTLKLPYQVHQQRNFHKKRRTQVFQGCGWCKVRVFKNFSEVLAHRATEKHLKNLADRMKNKDTGRPNDTQSHCTDGQAEKQKPRKVEMPAELDEYDPQKIVGQVCVVPVTGWFCKVCNKFYSKETAAKETHCSSELHFNNYKKFVYNKLKAEQEAAEKAAAEEEEKEKMATEVQAEEVANGNKTDSDATEAGTEIQENAGGCGDDQQEAVEERRERKKAWEDEEEEDEEEEEEEETEKDEVLEVGRGDSSNDQAVEQDPTGDEGPEKAMAGVVDNTAANGE